MAALLYNLDHMLMGNPKPGSFWMSFKIDFKDYNTLAVGDSIRCGKVRDGWIIRDSWYRMPTASTSAGTVDIGFGAAGQTDIAATVDLDGALTAWTQGTIQGNGDAELEITADEHLVLTVDTAVATDGVLEIMFEVVAGFGENNAADANIDD